VRHDHRPKNSNLPLFCYIVAGKKTRNVRDTYRHKGLRRQLVATLREKGIKDEAVLQAIEALPRHLFLDKTFEEWAYQDKALPIGSEQTISQPFTVAFQTELLNIHPREKVLEIGTGSGYQAALLALLGARVYTVERQALLHQQSRQLLAALKLQNVRTYYRDGSQGLPEHAPFDKIIVTAGATEAPSKLLEQLKTGGILVIPIGADGQRMHRIRRLSETEYEEEIFGHFRFVPLKRGLKRE